MQNIAVVVAALTLFVCAVKMRRLRTKLTLTLVAILLLLMLAVCVDHVPASVMSGLQHADQYELLSLDPQHYSSPLADSFHGWKILGHTSISDSATRSRLNRALRFGAWEDGSPAACFNPRHGIHLVADGKPLDLVICFECRTVRVFGETQLTGGFGVSGTQQDVFDEVLRDADIPLASR